ncbi:MAG: NAD-dependent epimerase/dehydratase family protein [Planctomycetia bacterium]|nr:NAD-dependent epimerase/dehydratase family protein [Planctomycetia bacterium]
MPFINKENSVYITGGTGFVGYWLAKRLIEKGYYVRCLVRKSSNVDKLRALGAELVEGVLNYPQSLELGIQNAKYVFHLAGLTRALNYHEFLKVNQDGCRSIAAACLETGKNFGFPPTLVSVSSLAGAGPGLLKRPDDPLLTDAEREDHYKYRGRRETDEPRPLSAYGRSKIAGEKELLKFADQIPISIVRPPYIFGPGDPLSVPLFKMAAHSRFFPVPGYFSFRFSFIHVEDLVELLIRTAERGERLRSNSLDRSKETGTCSGKGIYFAASPEAPFFSEFGMMLGRCFGRKDLHTVKCPPLGVFGTGLVQEIWKRLTHKQVGFDWNKAVEAIHGPWICSEKKICDAFHFSFPHSLQDRLQQTADWYLKEKWI